MQVTIHGLDELKRKLNDIGARQVPYAAARAITKTAKAVEARMQADMASAFQSPSPYVKRATFSTSATKQSLSATIGLKDMKPSGGTAPAVLLKEHFTGGARGNKPFEKALINLGLVPRGWRAITGSGIKTDSYGNPNRKEIGEMLSAIRSRSKMQSWHGKGKRVQLVGYFVIPVGARSHLTPGVYKRINREALKCLFVFVNQAAYRKVIDLQRSADEVVQRQFQANFDEAFTEAMRTAR